MDGYIRIAAGSPTIRVADPSYNTDAAAELARAAAAEGARVLCLPELCLTGRTCGDLIFQDRLLTAADEALARLAEATAGLDLLLVVGVPCRHGGRLYNAAAVLHNGMPIGIVPKHAPTDGIDDMSARAAYGPWQDVPFGPDLLFTSARAPRFTFAVAIGEDFFSPLPQAARLALAGASVVLNPAATAETAGMAARRRASLRELSSRLRCAYVLAEAGQGESTTDAVFSGHCIICENGETLAEMPPFKVGLAIADIDMDALAHDRLRAGTVFGQPYSADNGARHPEAVTFTFGSVPTAAAAPVLPVVPTGTAVGTRALYRDVDPNPFVPRDPAERAARCEEILAIQAAALARRVAHVNCACVVIGISGGLDSSLALLAARRAVERLGRPATDIRAVTLPCFGTTARTKQNAERLCAALGVSFAEINISNTVKNHFRDIGQPEDRHDLTYENAQARVRTLVLMDIAGRENGFMIGPGDLSELALGWTTYNGDHMSMYGVNAGIPKTLIRHIVRHVADTAADKALKDVLYDILATPVSPELLPPVDGQISQQTEDLVGPYELHDFFLYHTLRWGRSPRRVFDLARLAFAGTHGAPVIRKWLREFYRRFFSQQYKRNCLPDGPGVLEVSLSPRGGYAMPSDASCAEWLREVDGLPNDI